MIDPLVILAIGILTVIGMILVFRVNAFVALITAAVLVSLLSPGLVSEKISRMALAFGQTAGNIGIVIAMAAVIGKCLMDSGSADRIVRSFLNVLGEKRASMALMGSGFVLSIPVFFDTVFYLLVPLARSLWTKTRKNYMLYIMAIGTGAAITHTLAPPTPGPLLMATTLKVDIGVMMLVGVMIGAPTALVGLLICKLINRLMPIPMRSVGNEPEPEVLSEDELPRLWIALLPVLLPLLMISTNTATKMLADKQHAALIAEGQVMDWPRLSESLRDAATSDAPRAARPLRDSLPEGVRQAIADLGVSGEIPDGVAQEVEVAITEIVSDPKLYQIRALADGSLPDAADKLRTTGMNDLTDEQKKLDELSREELAIASLSDVQIQTFNWHLLEAAFPEQVRETRLSRAYGFTSLLGNPNLALLVSAAVAMFVLLRQRSLTLGELGKTTETALMSGGVIILITAGGGAFGAMLREAGVKDSIVAFVGSDPQGMGLTMLLLAFGVASVMKIAQGSGTVSMITTSAMMAAMGVSSEMLGCHMVYMCTAIGAGSLVGSWMNDSGFWIVAKMSGLTEVEALKSWTLLLVLLGFVSLGFTLLFASVLPMA